MTTVVSIGCSHTHGSMIDGENGTSLYNKENAYGPQLAKLNDFNFLNLGVPGASNTYIFRATINFLQKHLQKQEDYIFLIGWTSINRMEMRYDENNKFTHETIGDLIDKKYIPLTAGTIKGLIKTYQHRKMLDLSPLFYDTVQAYDEWAGYAFGLQKILTQKNIKHLMFNTCEELQITENNYRIIDNIDTTYYLHPQNSEEVFLIWGMNRGHEITECWHHKEEAHIAWAEYLNIVCKNLDYY